MPLPTTEKALESVTIDAMSSLQAASVFLAGQHGAVAAVQNAAPQVIQGAEMIARAMQAGGSIVYAAAGSSGLMALADACELPGTFGVSPTDIQIHMAGGVPVDGRMPGHTEDDIAAAQDIARSMVPEDVVIVLSASGTTPYALAVARSARGKGAKVIAIANNPGAALLDLADVAICLETPPEVIAGSTRLNAGTAQKAALNLMSSLMGIKLGHVYQGRMVNVVADNAKLIKRAVGMVAQIAGVSTEVAENALKQADGNPKTAILVAQGCSVAAAKDLLDHHKGHLGPSIKKDATQND